MTGCSGFYSVLKTGSAPFQWVLTVCTRVVCASHLKYRFLLISQQICARSPTTCSADEHLQFFLQTMTFGITKRTYPSPVLMYHGCQFTARGGVTRQNPCGCIYIHMCLFPGHVAACVVVCVRTSFSSFSGGVMESNPGFRNNQKMGSEATRRRVLSPIPKVLFTYELSTL